MKKRVFIKNERGAVLPIVVLFLLFVFFGIAALVVDVGRLYTEKRVLVTAADAGALAGAKEMQKLGSTESQIRQAAIDAAKYNGADEANIVVNIDLAHMSDSINDLEVEVNVENTVEMFFAKAIGINTSDVPARAVARPMRLNPGIFPIGIDKSKAYVGDTPKGGLIYLHDSKEDPSYFSDLLNLDGVSGNTGDINDLILDRNIKLGSGFAEKLSQSLIKSAGGWKNIKSQSNTPTIELLLQRAYDYSTDVNKRQAFMTALAPVYTYVDIHNATILEFAEIVIVDQIVPKNQDITDHPGVATAFPVTVSGNTVTVEYTKQVNNDRNRYPLQPAKNNADVVVAYFTGTTVSIADVLNGNYKGTLYDQVKFNAVSLVE